MKIIIFYLQPSLNSLFSLLLQETQELRRIAAVNECVRLAGERHGSLKKNFEEIRQR